MLPYFEFEKIHLGPIPISVWGIFIAIAFLLGLYVAIKEAKRLKIDPDHIVNLAFYIFIGVIIGSRLVYIAIRWDYFSKNLVDIFKIWQGGMVFYGGIIGAWILIFLYAGIKKLDIWKLLDINAVVLSLGTFIGRIGCFMIHDHLGRSTSFVFGINSPWGVRHETALYSSLNGLLMFLVFWGIRKHIKKPGVLGLLFFVWYVIARFFIDMLRATDFTKFPPDPRFWDLTISQYISIGVFIVALLLMFWRYKKRGLTIF